MNKSFQRDLLVLSGMIGFGIYNGKHRGTMRCGTAGCMVIDFEFEIWKPSFVRSRRQNLC